jgi:hypothetical protein
MKKLVLLLSGLILSLYSFPIFAKIEPENPKNRVVKKYSVGKPGYNRHVVKVYQKKVASCQVSLRCTMIFYKGIYS